MTGAKSQIATCLGHKDELDQTVARTQTSLALSHWASSVQFPLASHSQHIMRVPSFSNSTVYPSILFLLANTMLMFLGHFVKLEVELETTTI